MIETGIGELVVKEIIDLAVFGGNVTHFSLDVEE